MINVMLLAIGLIGIPAVIAIHTDVAYSETGDLHNSGYDRMICGAAA